MPPWKMSTRRRPRTRLWSWSPSRRRRRGPRTSARRARAPHAERVAAAAGCCRSLLVPVVLRAAPRRSPGRSTPSSGEVGAQRASWPASTSAGSARTSSPAGSATSPPSFADTPVELVVGDVVYETTAAEIGLDGRRGRAPPTSALEVGETLVPARPALRVGRGRSSHDARRRRSSSRSNAEQVAATVVALEGDARTPPTEPTVELVDGAFEVVPGVDGDGPRHRPRSRAGCPAPPRRRWPRTPDVDPPRARGRPDPTARHRGGRARRRPRPPRRS